MNERLKYRIWDKKAKSYTNEIGYPGASFHCVSNYYLSPDGEIVDFVTTIGGNQDDATKGPVDQDDYVIQQYTGLTDSNEKEIYEGDILKISYGAMGDVIGQVLYEADHGGYIFQWERKGPNQNYINLNCDVAFESVIVGNIFENPELLN